MKPSRLLIQLLLVWLLLGLLAAVATILEWPYSFEIKLVFWCWFGLVALLALLDGFALRKPRFEATRSLESHLALGIRQRVGIRISNQDQQHQDKHGKTFHQNSPCLRWMRKQESQCIDITDNSLRHSARTSSSRSGFNLKTAVDRFVED